MVHAFNTPTADALANVASILWMAWTIWAVRELRRRASASPTQKRP